MGSPGGLYVPVLYPRLENQTPARPCGSVPAATAGPWALGARADAPKALEEAWKDWEANVMKWGFPETIRNLPAMQEN